MEAGLRDNVMGSRRTEPDLGTTRRKPSHVAGLEDNAMEAAARRLQRGPTSTAEFSVTELTFSSHDPSFEGFHEYDTGFCLAP
jgi:hypothetical protein